MKSKIKGVIGIGFALLLVASLMLFAIPAAAGPYEDLDPPLPNMWRGFYPQPGLLGNWFFDPGITQVGPLAKAINGDIYAYVAGATATGSHDIFKSTDSGRTWSVSTVPAYYLGGAVVDMVCSSKSEDVIYLTDGNYVWKSINGGASFAKVAAADLEKQLMGACGITITGGPITCIDVGYDGAGKPIVLIGTRDMGVVYGGTAIVGSVYWIADETFSATWTDLQLKCYGCCAKMDFSEVIAVGDGATDVFDVTLTNIPVIPGTITITDGVETFTDPDGDGTFASTGAGSGTIVYTTGVVHVDFAVAPLNAANITTTYDYDNTANGCYDVYAVAAAPGFESTNKVYVVITAPLTSITFAAATATRVEIRAGSDGATLTFDGYGAVSNLTWAAGDVTLPTVTLTAYEVATWTTTNATSGGTVTVSVDEGSISWRLDTATVGYTSGSAAFCGGTHALSTLGTVCTWTHIHELQWDCLWSFAIQHASRIMFPSYYATDPTFFVGVAGVADYTETPVDWGEGGDVYRVTDSLPIPGDCIDLNVQGFTTGCHGFKHANICSMDIDENDAMVAGAWDAYQLQSPTRVYYSADGGWTWAPSKKDPTGTDRTYVLFGGSIVAGTRGCDCAFSLSCGANLGDYFNQISLISMEIDQVLDMTHAPGYVFDSQIMYILTNDVLDDDSRPCYGLGELRSLLRWDGTYWERVHSSRYFFVATTQTGSIFYNEPLYDWVEVSPDFNSTDCVYMANTGFYMTRSIDAGCSWAPLVYPCYDRPVISAWIVVDEDTVLASGCTPNNGYVYRTTNHGAQPWKSFMVKNTAKQFACCGVDFDLSLPRAADSDVLLGDACGQVFLSQDLGETWVEVSDAITTKFNYLGNYNTYVVFDPGYGTAGDPGENMFYAAAGTLIGRCDYNAAALPFKQNWVYICPAAATCETCSLCLASGIDAAGDTALYVADAGIGGQVPGLTVSGTIGIACTCGGYIACDCDFDLDLADTSEVIVATSGTFINGELLEIIGFNGHCERTEDCECTLEIDGITVRGFQSGAIGTITFPIPIVYTNPGCTSGCDACYGVAYVLTSNIHVAVPTGGLTICASGVWRSLNPMDLMPPTYPAMVEWEFLAAGLSGLSSILHPEADNLSVFPDDLWLTEASNMLWVLEDEVGASPTNYVWMWDDPLAAQVVQVSPADGALLATETSATLEWTALDAATAYEVAVFVECPECLNPLEMKPVTTETTTATCITITGLTPGKTYFWKVRVACNSPQVSKWSDLRSFKTALGATIFCSPECGAENITLTPNFSWSAVTDATGYEIEVSLTEDFASVLASGTPTINAWDGVPELDYSTTYYWRVRAVKDGVYSGWTYCLFSTMEEPEAPVTPVEPVDVTIKEITPTWIWVIIGIGGALTIVVIILIVTTRRVP